MRWAKIGIWLDQEKTQQLRESGSNTFQTYMGEMLAHRGFSYDWLHALEAGILAQYDMILVALEGNDDQTSLLWDYTQAGGTVIALGNLNGWAERLECRIAPAIEVGYVALPSRLTPTGGEEQLLRCFNSLPWLPVESDQEDASGNAESMVIAKLGSIVAEAEYEAIGKLGKHDGGDEHADNSRTSPLLQLRIGQGTLWRWAVDIPTTVVYIQQGKAPVCEDGPSAPDGTAQIEEGILKSDDGFQLNWTLDRKETSTGMPYFTTAYTDRWREAISAQLVQAAAERGLVLPFKSYWPAGVQSVAAVSFDSDFNVDEHAEKTLQVLNELGIQTTWCMIEPGYSEPIYEKVRHGEHELAFHYNALEQQGGIWSEEEFGRQLGWLRQAIQEEGGLSNKNHYTRFQGWGELFAWCERYGIEADQTRGPSKKGNIGFLFGTCHPYFPIAWADEANRHYDVLEIGFLTQDLNLDFLADDTVIQPFLDEVMQVQGAAHFLFHQVHIYTQELVVAALRKLVAEAGKRGMPFWTSKQINDWERARREAIITQEPITGEVRCEDGKGLPQPLELWLPIPDWKDGESEDVEWYYQVPCRKIVIDPAYSLQSQ